MTSLELLAAVDHGARTVADVAGVLAVDPGEAAAQLEAAERDGLVAWEEDESRFAPPDLERRFVHLTEPGRAELHRMQTAGP